YIRGQTPDVTPRTSCKVEAGRLVREAGQRPGVDASRAEAPEREEVVGCAVFEVLRVLRPVGGPERCTERKVGVTDQLDGTLENDRVVVVGQADRHVGALLEVADPTCLERAAEAQRPGLAWWGDPYAV